MRPKATVPDGAVGIPLFARDGRIRAYTLVDAGDAEWAKQWRWSMNNNGYASRQVDRQTRPRTILLHRELLGLVPGDGIEGDHMNLDRLDNRRENLRRISQAGNRQNTRSRPGASSAYRGVAWYPRYHKWRAVVRVDGRAKFLGYYDDEAEAAEAAREGRQRFMPFAVD